MGVGNNLQDHLAPYPVRLGRGKGKMKAITQTDAEELELLRKILHISNIGEVEVRDAFFDCLSVVYWKSGKRELSRIRRKYEELAGLGHGRKK